MKTCSKCKVPKDASEFYLRSASEGTLRSTCKSCYWAVTALKEFPLAKICSKCKVSKDRSEFHHRSASPDRRASICKVCWVVPSFKELPPTKICSCCKISKARSEFSSNSGAKDRLQGYCKSCTNIKDKNRVRNRAREASRRRERYSQLSETGKEEKRTRCRNWRRLNSNYVPPCEIANPDYFSEYKAFRTRTDPNYKIRDVLRKRQGEEIKRSKAKKVASTLTLTGCSEVELWDYLESLFRPGMTIKNHGPVWHLDHIKPCAAFDLTDPEQQKACFHWTNLQPLFVEENRKKGAKYNG